MAAISIRPATVKELQNALNDRPALAAGIGSPVPDGWPEKDEMFRFAAERLEEHPDEAQWRVYLFFDEAGTLLGSGGYQGPPTGSKPDRIVEIGYEIAEGFRKRGLGTPAVSALIDHARESQSVDTLIARTAMNLNPSVRILKHLRFVNTGPAGGPDNHADQVWQWQLDV
jgi:ribosomal-protein-alanine N-acetyltransferase